MFMIDMQYLMDELSRRYPLFHSEDDFKFQLAWLIKELYPSLTVNLERKLQVDEKDRTDLVVSNSKSIVPVELKYKTIKSDVNVKGERFVFKYHGAHDFTRYDFLRDIVRIETLVGSVNSIEEGYVVIVTMDESVFKVARAGSLSASFPIEQGRVINGVYSYSEQAKVKYPERADALEVVGHYEALWQEYSRVDINGYMHSLYCLIVKITKDDLMV